MWKVLTMITLSLASPLALAHGNHESASALHTFNHLVSTGLVYLAPVLAVVFACLLVLLRSKRKPGEINM